MVHAGSPLLIFMLYINILKALSEKFCSELKKKKKTYFTLFKVVFPDIWPHDSFLDSTY